MMFTFKIREEEVGVADTTYNVFVHALHLKDATKKLKRHLENFYENKLHLEQYPELFKVTFTTNGGCLLITWKCQRVSYECC